MKYEFAIKKEQLNSGKEILTPVCRKKLKWFLFDNNWDRITCIYGVYSLIEIDWIPNLSYEECTVHIQEYQKLLKEQIANDIIITEFHNLEDKTI